MKLGVVVPCYRQERFLPRTLAAIEKALANRDWEGALVLAAPVHDRVPALSPRWKVISPPVLRPLTPGAARMLGFAACGGDWVLFADADVEIDAAWTAAAIEAATREPALAGLGGRLEEWFTARGREDPGARDMYQVGDRECAVDYLATLAFYRRDALVKAGGYEARLNSEEDFELGMRLLALGLELRSLGLRAARHWSAPRPSLGELLRRWRTGLLFGQGQVLRLYLGRSGFGTLLARQRLYLAALAMWGLGAATLAAWRLRGDARPFLLWLVIPLAVVGVMSARKDSLRLGALAVLTWTLQGMGLVVGLFRVPGRAPDRAREARC